MIWRNLFFKKAGVGGGEDFPGGPVVKNPPCNAVGKEIGYSFVIPKGLAQFYTQSWS